MYRAGRNQVAGALLIKRRDRSSPIKEHSMKPAQRNDDSRETLPIVEEELRVEKRQVATGKVRVTTKTEVSDEVARATLEGETVEVTRVPVNREVDVAPAVRTEGDVTVIPVVEEIVVVEKRLVLKEEIHLRRTVTREEVEVPVQLRKQRVVVEDASDEVPARE
jgi:stress response protein YsnF